MKKNISFILNEIKNNRTSRIAKLSAKELRQISGGQICSSCTNTGSSDGCDNTSVCGSGCHGGSNSG